MLCPRLVSGLLCPEPNIRMIACPRRALTGKGQFFPTSNRTLRFQSGGRILGDYVARCVLVRRGQILITFATMNREVALGVD